MASVPPYCLVSVCPPAASLPCHIPDHSLVFPLLSHSPPIPIPSPSPLGRPQQAQQPAWAGIQSWVRSLEAMRQACAPRHSAEAQWPAGWRPPGLASAETASGASCERCLLRAVPPASGASCAQCEVPCSSPVQWPALRSTVTSCLRMLPVDSCRLSFLSFLSWLSVWVQ